MQCTWGIDRREVKESSMVSHVIPCWHYKGACSPYYYRTLIQHVRLSLIYHQTEQMSVAPCIYIWEMITFLCELHFPFQVSERGRPVSKCWQISAGHCLTSKLSSTCDQRKHPEGSKACMPGWAFRQTACWITYLLCELTWPLI